MNLRQFANEAGVKVVPCGPGWGGRWGYTIADVPGYMCCGFKTQYEARCRWATDTFGEKSGEALIKLLESTK